MRLNTAQRLALNLDAHIVIDAGAGTGKTSTIVDRVIEHYLTEDQRATRLFPQPERPSTLEGGVIAAPASERMDLREWGGLLPGEVVLLTFTNRAADEMRDRLRRSISRLRPGPRGDDGIHRTDPRIRHEGFGEQLLTLLEDAPIGTIDSFLLQLVAPYRGRLGDALSRENISDARRNLLTESAHNTLWRLPSAISFVGDAVDAGIPAHIASEVLAARDRIAHHYSGRRTASSVLRSLVKRSVFIDETARRIMDESGTITPNLLFQQIIASIDPDGISDHANQVHETISSFCELIRENIAVLAVGGWPTESRMACLDTLGRDGPPEDAWGQLVWLSHVLVCTVSPVSLMGPKPTFFPHLQFPADNWPPGIGKYSEIRDKSTKEEVRDSMRDIISTLKETWSSDHGKALLHFSRIALMLDGSTPPGSPVSWEPPLIPLPIPLPERLHDSKPKQHYFTLEAEVRNLQDLYLVHQGFQGIIQKLKDREEVHDFDDIKRLAGDLLLANCPSVCRTFYHPSIQRALDSLDDSPWRDDHIEAAFSALSILEANPTEAGASTANLGAIRTDLESRYGLLKRIRRRYRAFIIDEAQDNSPLQWRLLSRLWGEREREEGDPPTPDTPWQPTVCYVGDVKQSIYAFRQAEVRGFLEFARRLRTINGHEFSTLPELTREPALRRDSHSRDPRNAHTFTIATAAEYMEKSGRDLVAWIPFDATDRNLPALSDAEVQARIEGMVPLQVNYRTEGGMLRAMNEWWDDVFNHRHRHFPNGDFYAVPQTLYPSIEKQENSGSIEWLCPLSTGGETNPTTDLTIPLNPFGPGKPNSLERQAMLIARRVRSLIEATPVRVRSAEGGWHQVDSVAVLPGDIMILLPSRPKIRDIMIRHLHDLGIPSQVDREGSLLDRPAVHALEGLLQFVARPRSRHHATWVARSVLIGLDDAQLQSFIGDSRWGENLLTRLVEHTVNDRQRALVARWCELSKSARLTDLLEETIDRSDILTAFPDPVSRQDVEQLVEVIRALSIEVGGDPIVLADRVRDLRERSSGALRADTVPPRDAVRVMTIHSAKGLEAKVVILADIFSDRQTNLRSENIGRLIVSPEFFAGNPKPWPTEDPPWSALWSHVKRLHQARKSAEARRLLYVGATRAKERLIIAGSPKGTEWCEGVGLRVPWTYDRSMPQLGQMWIESLRQGSWRRCEPDSPWLDENDGENEPEIKSHGQRIFDPAKMLDEASLGGSSALAGMLLIHHPDCFDTQDSHPSDVLTPLQRIERLDETARSSFKAVTPELPEPRKEQAPRVRITPSKLPVFQNCARRHWFETRGGMEPEPVMPTDPPSSIDGMPKNVDRATFGTIFHRVMEIGIGNPGPGEGGPSTPLLESWTTFREDQMADPGIHQTVFRELLPPGADEEHAARLVRTMAERVRNGRVGSLVSGADVGGHRLEGLRTEMPFHLALPTNLDTIVRERWRPEGPEPMVSMDSSTIEISGIIDLVLCTRTSRGSSTIRPVDLKTEDADKMTDSQLTGLLAALGSEELGPKCEAEEEILRKHRMQMALYYLALVDIEKARDTANIPRREVLPPAILVGVTGRMVEYAEDSLKEALVELEELLARTARIAMSTNVPLSEFPRLSGESSSICEECPFHKGQLPICGPQIDDFESKTP